MRQTTGGTTKVNVRRMCQAGVGGLGVNFTLSAAPSAKFGNARSDVPSNNSGMHKARFPVCVGVCGIHTADQCSVRNGCGLSALSSYREMTELSPWAHPAY